MNVTYVTNISKKPDIVFADFENELIAIICLCLLILTRGIVSTLFKWMKGDEIHHHVHYSDEFSTADLNLNLNVPKPKPNPAGPPNSPISEFDAFENLRKPKAPPRDALV